MCVRLRVVKKSGKKRHHGKEPRRRDQHRLKGQPSHLMLRYVRDNTILLLNTHKNVKPRGTLVKYPSVRVENLKK